MPTNPYDSDDAWRRLRINPGAANPRAGEGIYQNDSYTGSVAANDWDGALANGSADVRHFFDESFLRHLDGMGSNAGVQAHPGGMFTVNRRRGNRSTWNDNTRHQYEQAAYRYNPNTGALDQVSGWMPHDITSSAESFRDGVELAAVFAALPVAGYFAAGAMGGATAIGVEAGGAAAGAAGASGAGAAAAGGAGGAGGAGSGTVWNAALAESAMGGSAAAGTGGSLVGVSSATPGYMGAYNAAIASGMTAQQASQVAMTAASNGGGASAASMYQQLATRYGPQIAQQIVRGASNGSGGSGGQGSGGAGLGGLAALGLGAAALSSGSDGGEYDAIFQRVMQQHLADAQTSRGRADDEWNTYTSTFLPAATRLAERAATYDTQGRRDSAGAEASAQAGLQAQHARDAIGRDVTRRGGSLTGGNAVGLDAAQRFSAASGAAAADRNARVDVERTGIGLNQAVAQIGNTIANRSMGLSQMGTGQLNAGASTAATAEGNQIRRDAIRAQQIAGLGQLAGYGAQNGWFDSLGRWVTNGLGGLGSGTGGGSTGSTGGGAGGEPYPAYPAPSGGGSEYSDPMYAGGTPGFYDGSTGDTYENYDPGYYYDYMKTDGVGRSDPRGGVRAQPAAPPRGLAGSRGYTQSYRPGGRNAGAYRAPAPGGLAAARPARAPYTNHRLTGSQPIGGTAPGMMHAGGTAGFYQPGGAGYRNPDEETTWA